MYNSLATQSNSLNAQTFFIGNYKPLEGSAFYPKEAIFMPMPKGFKHSEETKKIMSINRKGEKNKFYGKRHTPESLKKMSEALKGRSCWWLKGKHLSEETKRKIGKNNKDRKHSIESRKKMSRHRLGKKFTENHKKNLSLSLIGHKMTEDTKNKISLTNSGNRTGDKNPAWKGGISKQIYPSTWGCRLRKYIKTRDKCICQLCFKDGCVVHHIDYDKQNSKLLNLITLCKSCHSKTNYNREYWKNYFILWEIRKLQNLLSDNHANA